MRVNSFVFIASLIVTYCIVLTTYAQSGLGFKIAGGLSRISWTPPMADHSLKVRYAPSGAGGLFYKLYVSKKSSLGIELLFLQIEGRNKIVFRGMDHLGNSLGEIGTDKTWAHASYIGIPLYYGYRIKDFTFTLGILGAVLIDQSAREKGEVTFNGNIYKWDNKNQTLNIDKYDYGARIGVTFDLSNKIAVEGNYYYGTNNIIANDGPSFWSWRIQQMTIGVRYDFLRNN